jgi:hypothetical protein
MPWLQLRTTPVEQLRRRTLPLLNELAESSSRRNSPVRFCLSFMGFTSMPKPPQCHQAYQQSGNRTNNEQKLKRSVACIRRYVKDLLNPIHKKKLITLLLNTLQQIKKCSSNPVDALQFYSTPERLALRHYHSSWLFNTCWSADLVRVSLSWFSVKWKNGALPLTEQKTRNGI